MGDLFNDTIYRKSPDNTYRYALGTKGEKTLYCIGVNPSTATPEKYDPTITRVSRTAQKMGFDSFVMLNLYPLRETNPDNLPIDSNGAVRLYNLKVINEVVKDGSVIWAAWGDLIDSRQWLKGCRDEIIFSIQKMKKDIQWVKMGELTNNGNPRHPLYLKYQPFSKYLIGKQQGKKIKRMNIRKPKLYELEAVYKMMKYIPEMDVPQYDLFFRMVKEEKYPAILVAAEQGRVTGMAVYSTRYDWMGNADTFLYCLAVEPEYRKRGVGKALVKAVANDVKKCGTEIIQFLVHKDNLEARKFYGTIGATALPQDFPYIFSAIEV